MWDWLKKSAKKALEFSAEQFQNQKFIENLLYMHPNQAHQELYAKVFAMDDRAYKGLAATFSMMIARYCPISLRINQLRFMPPKSGKI